MTLRDPREEAPAPMFAALPTSGLMCGRGSTGGESSLRPPAAFTDLVCELVK